MIFLGLLFVISCMLFQSDAINEENSNSYFDEVLTFDFPSAVTDAGLDPYELPNFTYNYQNRSHDGTAVTAKIYYHTGSLTGMKFPQRKACKDPTWVFSNISAECTILFPNIDIKYEARLQLLTSVAGGVRIRHLDFTMEGEITNMEADLEITASPHIKIPTVKNLKITNKGTPSFRFLHVEELSYENISSHFYHKFQELFEEAFYDKYREAFESAVQRRTYPFKASPRY